MFPNVNTTKPLRQLHYARFLSGDGNFKLQRVARKHGHIEAPLRHKSMLENGGFWVPEKTLAQHIGSLASCAEESQNQGKVR